MAYLGKRPGDTFPSDNAITNTLIADNAVTAVKIAENALTSRELAANTIATGNVADNAIDGTKIASNSILTRHIDDNQITADQIANDAVGIAQLADLARGKIIIGDSNGDPSLLAPGSDGQILKSDGTDIAWGTDEGKSNEEIQDVVGAMFSSNTETGIAATYEDGDGTIDLVVGTLNQDTTGTADNVTVTANNSTNETVYPLFVDGATGSQGAETDTGFTYNPSTGMLTATGVTATVTGNITGDVTGNTSGTAATVTTAAQPNITSLGTLTALTVDDIAVDGKVITMTGSTGDTATITVGTDGTLTVSTTDTAAAAANIQITADGTAELAGTTVTLDSGGGITLDADGGTITCADGGASLGTITSAGWTGAIADNSVTSAKIVNGTIVSADIAANTIATGNIADNAIDSTKIAQNSILTRHIDDSQVTNDHLAGSIANSKLANSGITISDGSNSTSTALGGTMTFSGTSNEVTVAESSGTVTIGLPDDVTIAGDLTVSGTTTTLSSTTINVADPLVSLATTNNSSDAVDIGLYGLYDTSGSQDLYGGLFRDASDSGKWKLFKDTQAAPTTTVNTSGTGYAKGTLVADLEGNVTGNITGTVNTAAQTSITSLGTLTALTVDNVVIDGAVIGHTGDTDLITLSSGVVTVAGEVDATSLDVSGNADIDGTLEADAYTVDGTALNEYIADTAGAMVGSNTESGITVTYQDGDNTIDFAVDAAQTGITSLLATDIKIGEDDQTKIDFETADEIHFFAANQQQFDLVDGAIVPTTDNDVDLGTSAKEFKDGYFDGTLHADAINFNGTAISATAAELNIMDGVTATATEINLIDGVTATTAELNILDGVTSTAAEINIVDGDTSATSTTLADADRVVVNDGGTMKQVALTDFETYFESAIDTIANLEVSTELQTPLIAYTDGDDAITIADGGGITAAAGITSTAASNTFGATSFNDANITNVGDIALDSISNDATDITINCAGDITLDAGGGDWVFSDDGTSIGQMTNSSSDWNIKSMVNDKDIVFQGIDNSSAITALTLDMSDAGTTIFNHDISLGDGGIMMFGAGSDLQLYHDGSDSYIKDAGTGNLLIQASDTYIGDGSSHFMVIRDNGEVGIGKTSPDAQLDVVETTAGTWAGRFENSGTGGAGVLITTAGATGSENLLDVRNGDATVFKIAQATGLVTGVGGNIGAHDIVTSAPSSGSGKLAGHVWYVV